MNTTLLRRTFTAAMSTLLLAAAPLAHAGKPSYIMAETFREDLRQDSLGYYVQQSQQGKLEFRYDRTLPLRLSPETPFHLVYGNLDLIAKLKDDPYYRVGDAVARVNFYVQLSNGTYRRVAQVRLDWRTRGSVYGTLQTWNYAVVSDEWLGFTQNVSVYDNIGPTLAFTMAGSSCYTQTPYSGTVKVTTYDFGGGDYLYLNRVDLKGRR